MKTCRTAHQALSALSALVAVLCFAPLVTQAQYDYVTSNGTITITRYTGPGGDVAIPNTINGLPVTSVGSGAFSYCTSLTNVTIGNSLLSIGDSAFYGCTRLRSVAIPDRVTSIGEGAFYGCSSLTHATLGNSVTSIGIYAFSLCTNLASIPIPDTVASIGSGTFSYCARLSTVTIGINVTNIGDVAFYGCARLKNVTIPDRVANIGESAFYGCTRLANATIGNSVSNVGNSAFGSCTSLTNMVIPNSVTNIGSYAFGSCTSLTSITIGDGVASIGDAAFYACTNLTGAYFRGNAPTLGAAVFYNALAATVYYLPATTGWGPTFGGCPTALWIPPIDDSGGVINLGAAIYIVGEGETNALITLKRTNDLASELGVSVCTSNGTAEAGSDYLSVCTNVLFRANQTNQTVRVPIINDCAAESEETILLFLREPMAGGRLGATSNAVLTIMDDDSAGVIQFSTNDYRVKEDAGQAAIIVRRTGGAACNVSVDLVAANGTATAGEDFEVVTTNLVFAAGQRRLTNMISILQDLLPEGKEMVSLNLRNPKGGAVLGSVSNAWLRIVDDESSVSFTNANYTVSEAGPSVALTVIRSGALTTTARVNYVTVDRSAVSPSDYGKTNGTLTFRPGVTFRTITIPIVNDTIDETNESFEVRLLNPTNDVQPGALPQAVVTILDDDSGGQVSFQSASYTVGEGQTNALITLKRTKGLASEVRVTVCTSNGTAAAGNDFLSVCTNILFKANQTNKTVKVPILNDSEAEESETVLLFLRDPSGGSRLGSVSNALLTIIDDDSPVFAGVDAKARNKVVSPVSVPLLLPPMPGSPTGVKVCWTSVSGERYSVERATNFAASSQFHILQSQVVGQTNTTCHTDSSATNSGPYFYRVRIER